MQNSTLEALSQLVTDAAKKAAEEAVRAYVAQVDRLAVSAEQILVSAEEARSRVVAALTLADTLNVASEQRIVATADVVLASRIDVMPAMSFDRAIRYSQWVTLAVVDKLGGAPDTLQAGHYGVVICLYRQEPKE